MNPECLKPTDKIIDVLAVKSKLGFTGVPITESGDVGSKLLGIVTNRDIDFILNPHIQLSEIMTKDLITGIESITLEEANNLIKDHKIGKLPIIDKDGNLV